MRLLRIDFTSDQFFFFFALIVLFIVAAAALDRASPKGKARRANRTVTRRPGEIID